MGEWFTRDFWRGAWRDADGATRVMVVVVLAVSLLVCGCFGTGILARLSTLSTTYSSGSDSGPSVLPTVPPAATNTPAPRVLTGATLGGLWSGFEDKYGPQAGGQPNTWDATVAGLDVQVYADLNLMGTDGQPHAYVVMLSPLDGSPWSGSAEGPLVQAFFPPDATHVQDVAANGGTAHIYRSALLGATFPASKFTNDAGTVVVPVGTFSWQCSPPPGGSGDDTCIVAIGTP